MEKTIALFPGQGSQHVGMAKALYDDFAIAREVFEEASDAVGKNLSRLCFDGPESDLKLTENTQPCLLTASVAAFRVTATETGFKPDAVAGHSLGEYSALVAAGALPLAAAARWVHERGKAMQRAVPVGEGTMAAVMGLEQKQVEALCTEATRLALEKRKRGEADELSVEAIVQPANYNSPEQIVIAGSVDAVQEAIALIAGGGDAYKGGRAIPLEVSAPFHTRLMAPARDRMAELFAAARPEERPRSLTCPYLPNRTARMTGEPGVVFELLVEQVDHPVLWTQTMSALFEGGFKRGVEFGPGRVLQGLAKRVARKAKVDFDTVGIENPDGLKGVKL